tara:strand:- start:225 stop:659 length:435 start_codon:yes stop_codon:yes gene_type:complete
MSKIRTIRGVGTVPKVERVLLFGGQQGNFDKGYKILDFQVTATDPTSSEEVSAVVNTIEVTHSVTWNWALNTQVAWAAWNIPINSRFGQYSNFDDEVILVEDVFIDFSGDANQTINWELKLEEVSIKDSTAALAMVQARAQGSD